MEVCRGPGSNQRPPDLQSGALPTELPRLQKLCGRIWALRTGQSFLNIPHLRLILQPSFWRFRCERMVYIFINFSDPMPVRRFIRRGIRNQVLAETFCSPCLPASTI
ncbi:hypothetical protein [Thermoplasma acidophilum]|uniref:Uncharacterized protein n=1 Tax=Thermoplasma acidophilum (strain ATCC 25905 / DSM 1728 / JCM 9062 / NBRC 15155 / AMRC-C165) TaxID=273075 RepID=Q9HI93_THEAC|nr:hypothetical protein [Thermoplasma acidophilum]